MVPSVSSLSSSSSSSSSSQAPKKTHAAPPPTGEPSAKRQKTSETTAKAASFSLDRLPDDFYPVIFSYLAKLPSCAGESVMGLANRDLVCLSLTSKGWHSWVSEYVREALKRFIADYRMEVRRIAAHPNADAPLRKQLEHVEKRLNLCENLRVLRPDSLQFAREIIRMSLGIPDSREKTMTLLAHFHLEKRAELRFKPFNPLFFQALQAEYPGVLIPHSLVGACAKNPGCLDAVDRPWPFLRVQSAKGANVVHIAADKNQIGLLKKMYAQEGLRDLFFKPENFVRLAERSQAMKVVKWAYSQPGLKSLFSENKILDRAILFGARRIWKWFLKEPTLKPCLEKKIQEFQKTSLYSPLEEPFLKWAADQSELKPLVKTIPTREDWEKKIAEMDARLKEMEQETAASTAAPPHRSDPDHAPSS